MKTWYSPTTGRPLHADTAYSLTDGVGRWPVIDAIPFLRAGREALAGDALRCLDRGDRDGALVLLLADQDDWWRGGPADPDALRDLVANADALTLRQAMDRLGWGPVGLYFAHRWSDPTFVAGLALVEAHWNAPVRAFELGCGIGHHLRALARTGVAVSGADVVFAKLWVARHFVVPDADLVCFDAAEPWPNDGAVVDLVICHDAFYFLRPKPMIAGRLRAMAGSDGMLAIGHVHNLNQPNHSAGEAVTTDELDALFPGATIYDDAELTRAAVEARVPVVVNRRALGGVEAFSLVAGAVPSAGVPRRVEGVLACAPPGTRLRRNPLYAEDGSVRFPSERYALEYGKRATYGSRTDCPPTAICDATMLDWVRRRELVDLPDRW